MGGSFDAVDERGERVVKRELIVCVRDIQSLTLAAVSEAFDNFRIGSSDAKAPLRDSCSGAIGGIGKAATGGEITCPKNDEK